MFEIQAKRDKAATSEVVDKVEMPKSTTDLTAWRELVEAENDDQLQKKVSNLAFMNYVIKRQGKFRQDGETGRWKYGEKVKTVRVVKPKLETEKVTELGYTEAQLEYMRSLGIDC